MANVQSHVSVYMRKNCKNWFQEHTLFLIICLFFFILRISFGLVSEQYLFPMKFHKSTCRSLNS